MHLVADSKRLSFSLELTPTLRLERRLRLGLVVPLDHFFDKKGFEDFSLEVFDDTHLLHFVSDSQRLSFALDLIPALSLGLTPGKTISVENLKPNAKDQYRRRRPGKNH